MPHSKAGIRPSPIIAGRCATLWVIIMCTKQVHKLQDTSNVTSLNLLAKGASSGPAWDNDVIEPPVFALFTYPMFLPSFHIFHDLGWPSGEGLFPPDLPWLFFPFQLRIKAENTDWIRGDCRRFVAYRRVFLFYNWCKN